MATLEIIRRNAFSVSDLVSQRDGKVVTTSMVVAQVFGMRNADVNRAIRDLISTRAKLRSLYESSTYIDKKGEPRPMYYINKDGFVLLAMGFTGKAALDFKIAYIKAFNEMEKKLQASEKDREFAEAGRLLDMCVALLNDQIADAVKNNKAKGRLYYDACGEVRRGIIYDPKADFRSKLANTFSQLLNAYLDAFYFINEMFESKELLDKIKKTLRV